VLPSPSFCPLFVSGPGCDMGRLVFKDVAQQFIICGSKKRGAYVRGAGIQVSYRCIFSALFSQFIPLRLAGNQYCPRLELRDFGY
jgi:hypothetical protein